MKSIKEYAEELELNMLVESVENDIKKQADAIVTAVDGDTEKERAEAEEEQKKYWIDLPYKFDIFSDADNKHSYRLAFDNIRRLIENVRHTLYKKSGRAGEPVISAENKYSSGFAMELPAKNMRYWAWFDHDKLKKASNNFTKIPSIMDKRYFTNMNTEHEISYEYNQFEDLMRDLKPYFKGAKLPCVMKVYDENKDLSRRPPFKLPENFIVISVDDKAFNAERREKVKELQNPETLVKWSQEAIKKSLEDEVRKDEIELARRKSSTPSGTSDKRFEKARYRMWFFKKYGTDPYKDNKVRYEGD